LITIYCSIESKAQSYDIYVLDKKTGLTRQVTSIPGGGEFNVSWSNNGKKMVHDCAAAGVQAIYITDVETGVSTPLPGAETGNDAAWSPDGERIAFDTWEDYFGIGWWIQNIYTVSPSGGPKSLVRFNAHHASWNPKGSKIAFDDNYGYIGTKDLNTGAETFVTYYGDRPAWSPNGQYIAFDGWWWLGGGVWVVKVDTFGFPQGAPIQLTTSGYGPAWSNNSKEIVFIDWPAGDPDLYSVSVTGGTPAKVAGRIGGFDKGDYDPACSNSGQYIAWSSYTDGSSIMVNGAGRQTNFPGQLQKTSTLLEQNIPNPFTSQTKIGFRIGEASHVIITVYNLLGQKLQILADGYYDQGFYTIAWDGRDQGNAILPKGLYMYEMRIGNNVQVKKMRKE
jgi:Tol biopolymer transport system component